MRSSSIAVMKLTPEFTRSDRLFETRRMFPVNAWLISSSAFPIDTFEAIMVESFTRNM